MAPAFVGFAAGALGALLGVGGGVILVPGLIFVAGLPFTTAVGTSLVCIVATSIGASAVNFRREAVGLELALEFQFYAAAGAVLAGLSAAVIPAPPLYLAFGLLLLTMAYYMWPRTSSVVPTPKSARNATVAGSFLGAGLVSGLLGVGGGVLNVPILHLMLRVPFQRAVATSVYMIGVTAASGAVVYLSRGDVDPRVAALALLGTLAGAGIAALLGKHLGQRWLKIGFVLLISYVGARMIARGINTF